MEASSQSVFSNFVEITLRHGCSPVNLLHIFRTPFFKNTSGLKPWILYTLINIDLASYMSKCLIRSNVSRSEMWPWNQYLKVFTSSGQPSLVKEKGNYRSETLEMAKLLPLPVFPTLCKFQRQQIQAFSSVSLRSLILIKLLIMSTWNLRHTAEISERFFEWLR